MSFAAVVSVADDQRQIGEHIAAARREAGLTQRELAEHLETP
jgi:DNA-binding XRE family transcriptional regulator